MKLNKSLINLIVLMLDAYKLFHRQMYPKNTILVYSNATPRSSKHYGGKQKDYVIVFGIQKLMRTLKEEFDVFFSTPWEELESFIKTQLDSFTGVNYDINHLKSLHELGYLPMVFKALPEGTKCPIGVPYMTMYNSRPEFYWLTNYLETWLSAEQWNAVTAATTADEYRQIFETWAMNTVGNTDFVPFQGHDFSMRGHNGVQASVITGLAHLTSFVGSDTVPAYLHAQHYYDTGVNDWSRIPEGIVATSVPATEHSVQCAHYNPEKGEELEYLDHILDKFPTGIVSIVCDGFDFWKFITEILPQRKEQIMARQGKVVVRPDSGNPADIICGSIIVNNPFDLKYNQGKFTSMLKEGTYYEINDDVIQDEKGLKPYETYKKQGGVVFGNPDFGYPVKAVKNINEHKGAIEVLWDIFGGTTTEKGYKLLDEHIGLIYGDAITLDRANEICARLAAKDFASINWVAGIGSYTYQMVTRDTHGQAFKATYVEFKGDRINSGEVSRGKHYLVDKRKFYKIEGKAIFKDPKTGDGTKKSAKGLIRVIVPGGDGGTELHLEDQVTWENEKHSELREVFKDGVLLNQETLFAIRKRIKNE